MSKGNVSRQEWADWLWAFKTIHSVVDLDLPLPFSRDAPLAMDLSTLPTPRPTKAPMRFAADLVGKDTLGAAYVLHGAHCSGGRVMAPILAKRGLPSAHSVYADKDAVRKWLNTSRSAYDQQELARETFRCLLATMDEIEAMATN